ncbi:MAG: hypothetical protein RM022_028695 [Nostoc sp. EfeVER01]
MAYPPAEGITSGGRVRTHALQNDSVKVVIKMDDTLTQSRPVQIYLDIT